MKCTIPEISWHNRDPVLALDIQPNPPDGIYRLATAGTDTHVVIWQLKILDNGGISVETLSDLTRHNRAVNAVRFSPDGEILATADDEAAIILWKKQETGEMDIFSDEPEKENKENWVIFKMLRGHLEDVYDISWSNCSQYLVSGSVDNTAMLWDISKGKHMAILKEHKGFVQGVAWDPSNHYVATLSSDRCCRIYNIATKKLAHKIDKASLPVADAEDAVTEKITRLFYDDTLKSFCRRLSFSPDGEMLLAPSGILEEEDGRITNVTYVFSRYNFTKPVLYLPTKDKYTLAVRFCPVLFELKPLMREGNKEELDETVKTIEDKKTDCTDDWRKYANLFDLPYRMIFAVATQNAIFLYDTQQPVPFGKISNMHYTRLSDVAWSSDGRILVVSSTDGYCSLVSFSEGELGIPYKKTETVPQTVSSTIEISQNEQEDVEMSVLNSPEHSERRKEDKTLVDAKSKIKDVEVSNKAPTPIAVRRLGDSSKPGKRVALKTLTTPSQRAGESSSSTGCERLDTNSQVKGDADDVRKKVDELKSPAKTSQSLSPSKTPTRATKPPRHVPLITLSSPKAKRNSLVNDSTTTDSDVSQKVQRENLSPLKTGKSASPSKTPSACQKTPLRKPLAPVSSPSGKKSLDEDMEVDEEVKKRFEGETESPAKTTKDMSPARTPGSASKTPRRVPLITLSSPKGKKNLGGDSR